MRSWGRGINCSGAACAEDPWKKKSKHVFWAGTRARRLQSQDLSLLQTENGLVGRLCLPFRLYSSFSGATLWVSLISEQESQPALSRGQISLWNHLPFCILPPILPGSSSGDTPEQSSWKGPIKAKEIRGDVVLGEKLYSQVSHLGSLSWEWHLSESPLWLKLSSKSWKKKKVKINLIGSCFYPAMNAGTHLYFS